MLTRNLSSPKRNQSSEQPCVALGPDDLGEAIAEPPGEAGLRLHPDLDGLHGAERDVGEDLGGGGAREVDEGLVLGGVLGAGHVGVRLLEVLVEAVLERALRAVAHERRRPSPEEAT